MFEIYLLGQLTFKIGSKPVRFPSKAAELLVFLALHPERPIPRRQIGGILWPDLPDRRALGNLNTILWRIRRTMTLLDASPAPIENDRETISLNPTMVKVDYWEWRLLLQRYRDDNFNRSMLARILSLSKGSLAEDADFVWITPIREKARMILSDALQFGAKSLISDGAFPDALLVYRRLLDLDPLDEVSCRELMRLLWMNGCRTQALEIYTSFSRKLKQELAVEPEADTLHLVDAIKLDRFDGRLFKTGPAVNELPELGFPGTISRNFELKALADLGSRAQNGSLVLAGVSGDIGVGKTHLVIEVARFLRGQGFRVLYERCEDVSRPGPYEVLLNGLKRIGINIHPLETVSIANSIPAGSSGRAAPVLAEASEARVAFFERLSSALYDASARSPLLFILEDVQFSDLALFDLMAYLQRNANRARVFLLMTWRSEDCEARLLKWLEKPRRLSLRIELPPLEYTDILELCAVSAGGNGSSYLYDEVWRISGGNPMLALEVIREDVSPLHAHRHRMRDQTKDDWRYQRKNDGSILSPVSVSEAWKKLEAIIRVRIRRLPQKTREFLTFACVAGRTIDLSLLVPGTGKEIFQHLDRLERTGFIKCREGLYEFVHDGIRQICYESLSLSARAEVHRELAKSLEGRSPDRVTELAHHYERAGDVERASFYWERVGDRATSLWAHRDALRAFGRALAWAKDGEIDESRRYGLLRKRVHSYELLGEIVRSELDISIMLEIACARRNEHWRCESLILKSKVFILKDLLFQAFQTIHAALSVVFSLNDVRLEAEARETLGMIMYRRGNYQEARIELLKAAQLLEGDECFDDLERIWGELGRVALTRGQTHEALTNFNVSGQFRSGNLHEQGVRGIATAIALDLLGRGDEAIRAVGLARASFHRLGNESGVAFSNNLLSVFQVRKGNFREALIHARMGLPFKCGRDNVRWQFTALTLLSFAIWLPLGNYAAVKRILAKAYHFVPYRGYEGLLEETAAIIALEEGNLQLASSLVESSTKKVRSLPGNPYFGYTLLTLGRIQFAKGDFEGALWTFQRAVSIFKDAQEAFPLPEAFSRLALVQAAQGDLLSAEISSGEALRILDEHCEFSDRPYFVYWAAFKVIIPSDEARALGLLDKAYRGVLARAGELGRIGRERFLRVGLNQEIMAEWEKRLGQGSELHSAKATGGEDDVGSLRVVKVLLPRKRFSPLKSLGQGSPRDPMIEVFWTLDRGVMDRHIEHVNGRHGLRRAKILRLWAEADVQGAEPRGWDLARVLGVSIRTVRDDITYLRGRGCLVTTRPGKTGTLGTAKS